MFLQKGFSFNFQHLFKKICLLSSGDCSAQPIDHPIAVQYPDNLVERIRYCFMLAMINRHCMLWQYPSVASITCGRKALY